MTDWIQLDPEYSTTRLVRKVATEVVESELKAAHKPEDQFETILFQPDGEDRKAVGGLRTKGYFKKSSEEKPLVTVITVVFNGEQHLEETILSVIKQSYDNVEYIIIDGGSTDGTIDIIRRYQHAIDYWVSEKDNGIYDAMNKGIGLSTGDIIGLINSDDYYIGECISLVVNSFHNSFADVVFGDKIFRNEYFKIQKHVSVSQPKSLNDFAIHVVHPTVFVKKKVYLSALFDRKYRIAADYDLLLTTFEKGFKFKKLRSEIAVMRTNGASSSFHIENVIIARKKIGLIKAGKLLLVKIFGLAYQNISLLISFKQRRKIYLCRGWSSGGNSPKK